MTGLKRSLDSGRTEGIRFIFGASMVILIQSFIAVTFSKYLANNPQIVENLKYIAIAVFLALSFMFFMQARRKVQLKEKENNRSSFVAGIAMASMNMLAIPFFLGYSTLMEAQGWMNTVFPHNIIFAFGAMLGAFGLFYLYILFADYINRKVQFVARNINYILSLLFLVLAITTIISTFS